jgi:small-conductance mechanosensitive channel
MSLWFQEFSRTDLAHHLLVAVVIVLAFGLASRAVRALLRFLASRVIHHTETVLDDRIVAVLLQNVRPLMILTGAHIAVRELRKAADTHRETLDQLLDYSESVLFVVVAFIAARVVIGVIRVVLDWYLERLSTDGATELQTGVGPLARKGVTFLVGLVALSITLDHFGVHIGSLLVSLGVGSLALALAAQDTIANMIGGFVIMIDRPFRVGDRVELPGGQVGDVLRVGLRSTKFLDFDNNVIVMPNAEIVKGRIVNHAYPGPEVRVLLRLGVAYGTEPDRVRGLLLDLARSHPDVLADPEPKVYCTGLGESAVEFTLVGRTGDYRNRYDAETTLREQAYARCLEQGIQIPFPQRVVTVRNMP